jgi:hypothetical protein
LQGGCQLAYEVGIAARLVTAQVVIEVQDVKAQVELAEDMQQTDRIRAARDSHSDFAAGLEHGVTFYSVCDAIEQSVILSKHPNVGSEDPIGVSF